MSAAPGALPSAAYAYQIATRPGFLTIPATSLSNVPSAQPTANYSVVPNTSIVGM